MKCSDAKKMLLELLDGRLDEADKDGVEQHLAGCDTCRQEYEQMSSAHEFLGSELPAAAESIGAPSFLALRIKHTLSRTNGGWWQDSGTRRVWAAAAAIAILIAASLVYHNFPHASSQKQNHIANKPDTIKTQKPVIVIIRSNDMPHTQARTAAAQRVRPLNGQDTGQEQHSRPAGSEPKVHSPVLVKPVTYNQDM
jgi:hypothetical protein